MTTSKINLSLVTGRSRRSSALDYRSVPSADPTASVVDDRLPSLGDISLSVTAPSPTQRRSRAASSPVEAPGPLKDRDSLTPSVSDVLSAGGDDSSDKRRDRRTSMRALLQTKIYNFLERPTGWRCFLYHFCVYDFLAFANATMPCRQAAFICGSTNSFCRREAAVVPRKVAEGLHFDSSSSSSSS